MKIYTKEIPGKAHENEDSHYGFVFNNIKRQECGIFAVADGCSGFKGTIASHLALKTIRDSLEQKIRQGKNTDYIVQMQKAILLACSELDNRTGARTTLELGMISQDKLYLAHLGDSRTYLIYDNHCQQITRDEDQAGIPTNFIGAYRIDSVSLEDRINFASSEGREKTKLDRMKDYQKIESLPRFIFMTTDGLVARATEQEIKNILLNCGKYGDPGQVLEKFSRIVCSPRQRLLFEENKYNGTLRRKILYGVEDFKVKEGISDEELVECILKGYLSSTSEELCQNLDRFLKFDDTTMVLVDLEDSVGKGLERLKRLEEEIVPRLTEERDGYQKKYETEMKKREKLSQKIKAQPIEMKELRKKLRKKGSELKQALAQSEAFKEELEAKMRNYAVEETECEEIMAPNEIVEKIKDLAEDRDYFETEFLKEKAAKKEFKSHISKLEQELREVQEEKNFYKSQIDEVRKKTEEAERYAEKNGTKPAGRIQSWGIAHSVLNCWKF